MATPENKFCSNLLIFYFGTIANIIIFICSCYGASSGINYWTSIFSAVSALFYFFVFFGFIRLHNITTSHSRKISCSRIVFSLIIALLSTVYSTVSYYYVDIEIKKDVYYYTNDAIFFASVMGCVLSFLYEIIIIASVCTCTCDCWKNVCSCCDCCKTEVVPASVHNANSLV